MRVLMYYNQIAHLKVSLKLLIKKKSYVNWHNAAFWHSKNIHIKFFTFMNMGGLY